MQERIAQITSEQNDVNPAQTTFMLDNQAKLPGQAETFIGDTNAVNKDLNNQLLINPRFIASSEDNTVPEARNFRAIRNLLADRNHASNIKKYGNEYERREGIIDIDEVYDKMSTAGQVRNNWNFAMQGLLMGEKQSDLMKARESGDPQLIEEALASVQKQQEIVDQSRPAETSLGRGLLSFGSSIADNPLPMIAATGITALTAGAGAPLFAATLAGSAVSATGTYVRTAELESGLAYQEIKNMYPDLPEARAASLAQDAGIINGVLESVPMLFSGGIVGRGITKINRPVARAVAKAGISKKILENPEFVKQFGYEIKKQTLGKWVLDTLADTSIDTAQEVIQNAMTDAATRVAGGKAESIIGGAAIDLGDFIANPTAPEHADKWNTIVETALASPFFSAGFTAAGDGIQSGVDALGKKNITIADGLRKTEKGHRFAEGLFNWRQTSKAAKEAAPTTRAHLETMVSNGQVPSTVFIDESMAQEIIETRQDVAEKLKIGEALANKTANGGMIEVSLLDYDEVVNSDGELYQQIKNNISFSPDALSTSAFMDRVLASEKSGAELSVAIKDKSSVYNNVLKQMSRNKNMTSQERQWNASLAQLFANRMSEMTTDNQSADNLWKRVEISMGRTNPTAVMESKEDVVKRQSDEKELKRRVRITDSDTLGQILSERGFPIRGLTGREIRAAANANLKLFTLNDRLTEKSQGQRIQTKISSIEQNKAQGEQLLLDAGMTQEQIDSLTDDEFNRLVISEFKRNNKELGITDKDTLLDDDSLAMLKDWDELFQTINIKENINSPEFKKWFGDSKVVDADGKPLVVYHKTTENFDTFDKSKGKLETWGKGFYFVDENVYNSVLGNRTVEAYLSIKNPLELWDRARDIDEQLQKVGIPKRSWLSGDQAMQDKLKSQGYDGIVVHKQKGERYFIAFEPNQIKSVNNQGTFSSATGNIYYQETNNNKAGSFKKEFDKYIIRLASISNPTTFSHEMFHLFNTYMMEQYNSGKLTEYWKKQAEILAQETGGKIEDGIMTFDRDAMENGADAFTNYIRTGEIPNAEMRPMLSFMKHLFMRVYRILGIRKVRLNKNISGVFDSIFMAQKDVEQIQRNLGLLAVEKPTGGDNDLYDVYQSLVLTNRASASNKYVQTVEAYNKEKSGKEYNDAIETRTRELIGVLKTDEHYKIKARYDELIMETPENAMGVLQAEYLGEYSAEELNQYTQLPAIETEARTQAELEMDEAIKNKYDLLDETLAEKSIKNIDKSKALLAESVLLNNGTLKDFERAWIELNDNVDATLVGMNIDKIIDTNYWRDRETMAVERYAIFKQSGQNDKAAGERRTQAILSLIRIKSDAMKNRVNRFNRHARKFRGNQETNIMAADSYDLLQSMLKSFGFPIVSRRTENLPLLTKLEKWTDRQENDFMVDINRARPLFPEIAQGSKTRMGDITMSQYERLELIFNLIDKVSTSEWKVQTESEKILVQNLLNETADLIESKKINTDSKMIGNFANPEAIMKSILPQNVIDAVVDPLFNSMTKSELALKSWNAKMDTAMRLVKTDVSEIELAGIKIKNRDVADLLLSMGTEHAYQNMIIKLGIDDAQAQTIASEALRTNPQYEQFMNSIWGIYDEVVVPLNDSYLKTFNRIFIKKEPRGFKINGIEFKGGYVPENKITDTLVYDQQFMSKKIGELSNEKLIEKEADGEIKSIVDNMPSGLFMMSRMAYVRVAYNNAMNVFGTQQFKNIAGDRVADFIKDWMLGLKNPTKTDSKMMARISSVANAGILGWSITRSLVQISGIIPAMSIIKPRYMVSAIPKTLKAMAGMDILSSAKGLSEYMQSRYEDVAKSILGVSSKNLLGDNYAMLAMYPLTYGDAAASYTVWNAAYAEAIDKGRTDQQATADADSAVRLTQSDSMTASRANAMQSQWARIITPFLSYIMSMQSIVRGRIISGDKLKAAQTAFMYIILAPVFESMAKELIPDDDKEDQGYWERVSKRWLGDAAGTLGASIIPVAGIGSSAASGIVAGATKAIDPDSSLVKSYQMSIPMTQYLDNIRQILFASPQLLNDELRGKALQQVLLGTAGLSGNIPKKIVKRFLADD